MSIHPHYGAAVVVVVDDVVILVIVVRSSPLAIVVLVSSYTSFVHSSDGLALLFIDEPNMSVILSIPCPDYCSGFLILFMSALHEQTDEARCRMH